MKKLHIKFFKKKFLNSEISLKLTAIIVSTIFAGLMLYPLLYTASNSMKDNNKIYDLPPKLLPDSAKSLSIVIDYTDLNESDTEELKEIVLKDNVLIMFGLNYKLEKDSLSEIKVYGTKNGKTIFYSRAHQIRLQMERDYGIYKGSSVKETALLYKERYIIANNSIGYEFNPEGLDYTHPSTYSINNDLISSIESHLSVDYPVQGRVYGMVMKTNNLLLLENFKYYINMPQYAYSDNTTIQRFGFMTFVGNSVMVIGWAILAQVFLCSICAFVISRLLSKRAGRYVLLFFLGAMMIPFASIMLPQLIMYRSIGAYNNYTALLLPFLYPFGFYIYLYKGFFDQIPSSYFEAAKLADNKGYHFGLSLGVNKKKIEEFKNHLSILNLGLEDKINTKVGMLSGGQRQALSLLMATLNTPKILLLDEHTAALDPKTSETIINLTNKIIKEKNITAIMITHNLSHAIEYGNRLLMMHRGEAILDIGEFEKSHLTKNALVEEFSKITFKEELSDRMMFG